jgi:propionate catabolism operon transcriptional regulator
LGGRIVFISPDEKLAMKARMVIEESGDQIQVFQGSLSEGVIIAKNQVEMGTNIIISRGETGNLIKKNLNVPVVNVETNAYDVFYAISQALPYSKTIGLIGFENLVRTAEKINRIITNTFSIQIQTAMAHWESEVEEKVDELVSSGIKVILGGNAVYNAVNNKPGCKGILLESGEEAISEAIKEAKNLLEVQTREKEKAQVLESIIDFAYDGIIGIDVEGKITVFNPIAEKITGFSSEYAIGRYVDEVVENSRMIHVLRTGQAEKNEFQHIGNYVIATNRIPIIVDGEVKGVVATFQEVERIQNMERQIRKKLFLKGHIAKTRFDDIIGNSEIIKNVKARAEQFAKVDSTILIQGETGTGKELFTQSIHNASLRANKPFVAVNCAALPENLLESELFGYVDGAFTGARKSGKPGLFELAHSGTIFLDEISEMSPKLQARFLRVLQEKEVVRIGEDKVLPVDVRVIAATNRDLLAMVKDKGFREDLYYRLCVLQLIIPPLRERTEDIIELAKHFADQKGVELFRKSLSITDEALKELTAYSWPGNVRHLENVIERAVVISKGDKIDLGIIKEALNESGNYGFNAILTNDVVQGSKEGVLRQLEDKTIIRVLNDVDGNRTMAAKKLGISVTTLWRRLKQLEKAEENIKLS